MKLVLRSARSVTAVSVSLLNLPIVSDRLLLLSKIDSDLKRKRCDTEERFAIYTSSAGLLFHFGQSFFVLK